MVFVDTDEDNYDNMATIITMTMMTMTMKMMTMMIMKMMTMVMMMMTNTWKEWQDGSRGGGRGASRSCLSVNLEKTKTWKIFLFNKNIESKMKYFWRLATIFLSH